MSRKTCLAAEVLHRRNGGYTVRNARTNKVLDHTFGTITDALAFAQSVAQDGTRAATAALNRQLTDAAASAAASARTSTSNEPLLPISCPPRKIKREDATREDITAAFGEAAYWRSEITRLTKTIDVIRANHASPNPRKLFDLEMLLLNAQTQLSLHA